MTKPARTGRPSKLTKKTKTKVFFLAKRGFTDAEIAMMVDVTEQTVNNWKKSPEFFESLKGCKAEADALVERSLFERAIGYSHPEDKIFCHEGMVTVQPTIRHYPPDTTAAIFWLKNRKPLEWKEQSLVNNTILNRIETQQPTPYANLREDELRSLAALGSRISEN